MDQNQNLEANQIGSNSSKKEDSAITTSLYNNNQPPRPPVKSPRPPPTSPATKKFASVANQIGSNSSKKEDSITTTSLYSNNQPPRLPPSSPATKKFASVARSFIRAVFCSPVKNEQKSIRKLSNPEAAAEAAEVAATDNAVVAMPPPAHRHLYQGNLAEKIVFEHAPPVSNRRRQRCVSEAYKPKLTLSSRNQMNETCSRGILFLCFGYLLPSTIYAYTD